MGAIKRPETEKPKLCSGEGANEPKIRKGGGFERFESTKSQYFDLAVTAANVMERLREHLQGVGPNLTGTVMFFVDISTKGLETEIASAMGQNGTREY